MHNFKAFNNTNNIFIEEVKGLADASLRHIDRFKYGIFTGSELLYPNKVLDVFKSK